jgi:hypothetical protein
MRGKDARRDGIGYCIYSISLLVSEHAYVPGFNIFAGALLGVCADECSGEETHYGECTVQCDVLLLLENVRPSRSVGV